MIFVFAFFISMFYSAYAIANYFVYGNCDPGQPASHCIIGQAGAALKGIWPLLTCGTAYALYAAVIVVVIAVVVIRILTSGARSRKNGDLRAKRKAINLILQ